MKTNFKNLMLLTALATLGTACTNDENFVDTPTTGLSNEIQLEIGGKGDGVEYTKAIASDIENKIDNLEIYVFGSKAETKQPYYFLEKWTSGAADDKGAKTFTLQDAGTKKKVSIFPSDIKNLPYLKLYLVANPSDNLYKEDGTTGITLTAITSYDGTTPDPTGATTETDFVAAYSKVLEAVDNIMPPLTMTGMGQTKIVGTVSKLDIDLQRTVARFDIDNTTASSNLTIQTITIVNGRKTAPLWTATPTTLTDGNRATYSMTYHEVDYTDLLNANKGITESAIYANPSLATDKCALLIKGTYKTGATGAAVAAEYTVPFQKTDENTGVATPIAILRNNRYTLRILDVTTTTMKAVFDIEDWTSAGGMEVKPENDAPTYTEADMFEGTTTANKPEAIGTDLKNFRVAANKIFYIKMAATSPISATKYPTSPQTKADPTPADWFTIYRDKTEQKDGIYYSIFKVATAASLTSQQPVSVRFTSQTASLDPDLQPVLTFFAPAEAPQLADGGDNSAGNTVATTSPATSIAATASMVKEVGSYITVKVQSFEGLILPESKAGFRVTEVARDGFTTTYKVEITNVDKATTSVATSGVFTFKNAGDDAKTSTLTVTLAEPTTAP